MAKRKRNAKKENTVVPPTEDTQAPAFTPQPEPATGQVALRHRVHRHHYFAGVFVLLTLTCVAFLSAFTWYYHDRALPGVSVANIDVGGKKYNDIQSIAASRQSDAVVTFSDGSTQVTAPLGELGISNESNVATQKALDAKRGFVIGELFRAGKKQNVPLQLTTDFTKLNDFLAEKFPHLIKSYKDAELAFNDSSRKFEIVAGVTGQAINPEAFSQTVAQLANNPQALDFKVATVEIKPVITTENLAELQRTTNERLGLQVKFSYRGKVMYTATPADIAKWATFTPDPAKNGQASITYDKTKVTQFLTDKVGPKVAAPPTDRKIIKNEQGGEIVIQQGQVGRQLKDLDPMAEELAAAISQGKAWEKEVSVIEAPYKTVTLTGYDHWVEVDLSEQRTTLYNGSNPVRSFTISSGLSKTPTVTGEFTVWHKTRSQTMSGGSRASGDYYSLPNVTWVTYFYKDYSFHTAYWHNNFGTPMSHGCVNMREADAKVLYDFAPIGTKVIVHQ